MPFFYSDFPHIIVILGSRKKTQNHVLYRKCDIPYNLLSESRNYFKLESLAGLHFCRGQYGMSSFTCAWRLLKSCAKCITAVQRHRKSSILVLIEDGHDSSVLHHFGDTAYRLSKPENRQFSILHSHLTPSFLRNFHDEPDLRKVVSGLSVGK